MTSETTLIKEEIPLIPNKTFSFQPVTHSGYTNDKIMYDSYKSYIKDHWLVLYSIDKKLWYNSSEHLTGVYHNYSISAHFDFRDTTIPKRCEPALSTITEELITYLKSDNKRTRVSKIDAKISVKYLLKHLSRVKYHKSLGLRYNNSKNKWGNAMQQTPAVKRSYFLELLDMLEKKGSVIHLRGFGGEDSQFNITNMIVPSQEFVEHCNGKNPPDVMEECLRKSFNKLCLIRERVYRGETDTFDKVERKPRRGEKSMVDSVVESMKLFNQHLEKYEIEVNGVCIPETFYHRTYIQDLHHGGRLVCGEYQSKSKKDRLTTLIDGVTNYIFGLQISSFILSSLHLLSGI